MKSPSEATGHTHHNPRTTHHKPTHAHTTHTHTHTCSQCFADSFVGGPDASSPALSGAAVLPRRPPVLVLRPPRVPPAAVEPLRDMAAVFRVETVADALRDCAAREAALKPAGRGRERGGGEAGVRGVRKRGGFSIRGAVRERET